MLPVLQKRFEAFELETRAVQTIACRLSPTDLNWQSAPGEWSALQIVEHLVLADETIGLPLPTPAPPQISTPFLLGFVRLAFSCNVRLPLPSPHLEPPGQTPLPILLERWGKSHQTVHAIANGFTEQTAREKVFLHPIIGALTPAQILQLGATHTAYHRRQLERLVARLPKG